jgi:hypothetical protein
MGGIIRCQCGHTKTNKNIMLIPGLHGQQAAILAKAMRYAIPFD